jgi:hypothetical protein
MFHKSLNILSYHVDSIGRYERTANEEYIKLKKAAQYRELTINQNKKL